MTYHTFTTTWCTVIAVEGPVLALPHTGNSLLMDGAVHVVAIGQGPVW